MEKKEEIISNKEVKKSWQKENIMQDIMKKN